MLPDTVPTASAELEHASTNPDANHPHRRQELRLKPVRTRAATVQLSKLHPNPDVPGVTTEVDARDFAASIRVMGLVSPLLVTEHPERQGEFFIIDGRKRFAGLVILGGESVPVIIREGRSRMYALADSAVVSAKSWGPHDRLEVAEALVHMGFPAQDVPLVFQASMLQLEAAVADVEAQQEPAGTLGAMFSVTPGVDLAAVDRAVGGVRSDVLTVAERRDAVYRLVMERRLQDSEIANLLGVCSRTVRRDRVALNLAPGTRQAAA